MTYKPILLFLLVMPSFAVAGDLNTLYAEDYDGFWKQWRQTKATAVACSSAQDMAVFLSNAVETMGNAEVTEANAKVIEELTVANTECLLRGLRAQQPEQRTRAITAFLAAPLFRTPKDLEGALRQVWGKGLYVESREIYEKAMNDR